MKIEREPGTDAPDSGALLTLDEVKKHLEMEVDESVYENSDSSVTLAIDADRNVTGVNTRFDTDTYWQVGLAILINEKYYVIEKITSETAMTIEDTPRQAVSATSEWQLVVMGDHSQDSYLKDIIEGVYINLDAPDSIIGRSLGEQTLRMTLNGFPRGTESIRLRYPPVREIKSIRYDANDIKEVDNSGNADTTLEVATDGTVTGAGTTPPDFEGDDQWSVGRKLTVDGNVFYIKEINDATELVVSEGPSSAISASSNWQLGIEHELFSDKYRRWDYYGFEYITPSSSNVWPVAKRNEPGTVRIVYDSGEADCPHPLKIAARMMLHNLWERRDEVVPARIAVLLKNPAIDRLMNPYNMTGPE